MILIIGLMALVQTGFIGLFALHILQKSLNEQIGERALNVAITLAATPDIIKGIEDRNVDLLQQLSLKIAEKINATFVVIGDKNGIRLAHPNTQKIGHPMLDDEGDDNTQVLIEGKGYISKDLGSLGWSMRGKAPVFNINGQVIGIVSVGYHLQLIEKIIEKYRLILIIVIITSFIVSALIAIWFSNHFKKAIFGLEPEQIAHLFDEQKAILESIREGVIAVNNRGKITTINHTAMDALGLRKTEKIIGKAINTILTDTSMLDVIKTGKPQFDKEVLHNNHILIVNRLPIRQGNTITGVVSSFRKKDELDLISKKLTRIQQYADSLRSQAHEYTNKLHTIAGLIQIGAKDKALELIGQENQEHQELIKLLMQAIPDPILAGCLIGKYNRARELGLQLIIDKESQMSNIPETMPREKLVSIIGNLIDNAFEATLENKSSSGKVTLSMTDSGNDLIFEIEDQGLGIPDSIKNRIFDKGVSSKNEYGHGFGLHLVKKFIADLKGSISISPSKSGGSIFIVYIPKIIHNNQPEKL